MTDRPKPPPGIDVTCRHCGETEFYRPRVSVGHQNGKTFVYCRSCMVSVRNVCGECGKILWQGNTVMLDDGPYCSDCKPDHPIWEEPESTGETLSPSDGCSTCPEELEDR